MRFLEGAPVFAVEVRSEPDYGQRAKRDMAAKRAPSGRDSGRGASGTGVAHGGG
jgi:hypothetical protein